VLDDVVDAGQVVGGDQFGGRFLGHVRLDPVLYVSHGFSLRIRVRMLLTGCQSVSIST
jgi:hypothetical protein